MRAISLDEYRKLPLFSDGRQELGRWRLPSGISVSCYAVPTKDGDYFITARQWGKKRLTKIQRLVDADYLRTVVNPEVVKRRAEFMAREWETVKNRQSYLASADRSSGGEGVKQEKEG